MAKIWHMDAYGNQLSINQFMLLDLLGFISHFSGPNMPMNA